MITSRRSLVKFEIGARWLKRFFPAAHTHALRAKEAGHLHHPTPPSSPCLSPHTLLPHRHRIRPHFRFMAISTRLLASFRQCPSCIARHGSARTWTSAAATATRSTSSSPPAPSTRLPVPPSSSSVPDLCLGAGGKAPGFVQQMLFSAPVPEKNTKGNFSEVGGGETYTE